MLGSSLIHLQSWERVNRGGGSYWFEVLPPWIIRGVVQDGNGNTRFCIVSTVSSGLRSGKEVDVFITLHMLNTSR